MTNEQRELLLQALDNALEESLFNLDTALRALERGVPGELVIRFPRKGKGHTQVGWRSGIVSS